MSDDNREFLEKILSQLKCHFTWNLFDRNCVPNDLECTVLDQIHDVKTEFKATLYNLLAYIKHCRGENTAALNHLQQAEELIQQEPASHADIRSLVTWGNYAWVYYHMGRLLEVQIYVDKVKQVCAKFSSSYTIECPEMYSEEGWARLKCGNRYIERAKVCFEKALEIRPENPEFTIGIAIATYRLDENQPCESTIESLKQAIKLSPGNCYVKVLLALTLQRMKREAEGKRLVEEALEKAPHATNVIRKAAKFYRIQGDLDKTIELLERASENMPQSASLHFQIGSCYRKKILQKVREKRTISDEEKQNFKDLIERGLNHLMTANKINGHHSSTCLYIADLYALEGNYKKAEYYFQEELTRDLTPLAKQKFHLHYGNFQLYQMKCEDKAILHYIEGVKIDQESYEKNKMKYILQNLASKRP